MRRLAIFLLCCCWYSLTVPACAQADADLENAYQGEDYTHINLGQADGDWAALLREHIPQFGNTGEQLTVTPSLLRKLKANIADIMATEAYFSPEIRFDFQSKKQEHVVLVNIQAGPRTVVENVELVLQGPLADAANSGDVDAMKRREQWLASWKLRKGKLFRDADWSDAKNAVLEALRNDTYAAARIVNSRAYVDQQTNRASLRVEVDSGPVFTLGEMKVTGLQRYPLALLQNYHPPKTGESYSRARLLAFQSALQNSAYFSTVSVSIDADPEHAQGVPLEVAVVERRSRDIGLGLGYSTNTGYRGELSYRDRNLLDTAWDLRSAIRIEQKQQLAYTDVYLPPKDNGALDSFGVLIKRQDLAGLLQTSDAIGVKRNATRGNVEQRLGLNFTFEKIEPDGVAPSINRALVASVGWTWHGVDDQFAPRQGSLYQLDLAASDKALLSDQNFIRVYGRYQHWFPIARRDVLTLRAEVGQVFAPSADGIPEDYLFRTGGSTTVRGYSYQSIGVIDGGAVVGGRVMTTASAEYIHWLNPTWGAAVFVDVGDAADTWQDVSLKKGVGIGARYKTPAGPLALDLAYGCQDQQFRLGFSISIAF
jgi:translocation and assembly module TamA